MIYLDNAATTAIKPKAVADAVYRALTNPELGNSARGGHRAANKALEALFKTRQTVAQFFGMKNPLSVALTQNASASLNLVIKSLFQKGDHIITSEYEHNSVLRPLYQQLGENISFVPIDTATGRLQSERLPELLKKNTRALIVTHASNVSGVVSDITAFHDFCKKHNLMLIIDASQSSGIIDIDLSAFEQTILCFTGHKSLYGPQGTGGIVVNGDFDFQPVFSGGSGIHSFAHVHPNTMPDVFEVGTMNVPAFLGLQAGIEYVNAIGLNTIEEKLAKMRKSFVAELQNIPAIQLYGNDTENRYTPVIAFNLATLSSAEVSTQLNSDFDIAVRSGAHCAPKAHEAFGTVDRGMLRASFSHFTTQVELDACIEALKHIAKSAV